MPNKETDREREGGEERERTRRERERMTNKETEREREGGREKERENKRERELKRLVVQTSESCSYHNILIVISLWTLFYPIIIILIMRHFMLPCRLTNIRKGCLTNNNSLVQCNCRSCHNKK